MFLNKSKLNYMLEIILASENKCNFMKIVKLRSKKYVLSFYKILPYLSSHSSNDTFLKEN